MVNSGCYISTKTVKMELHEEFDITVNGIIYKVKVLGLIKGFKVYQIVLDEEEVVEIYLNGDVWTGATDFYNRDQVDAFGAAIQEKLL